MEQVFFNVPLAKIEPIFKRWVREAQIELQCQQVGPAEQTEQLLTIQEAADFLHLKVPSIYLKVSRGELPVMKRGKRLYFSSTELLEYIKEGRKKTNAELEAEAESYLKNKGDADLHKNKIKPTKANAL